RVAQACLPLPTAPEKPECAQGDADRPGGAPAPGELELLGRERASLLVPAERVEGERRVRPPGPKRGVADLQSLQDPSDLGEVGERLTWSLCLEPELGARVASDGGVHARGKLLIEAGERERGLGLLALSLPAQQVGE